MALDDAASLRRRLREALPAALKARDRAAVAALRSALAAIENASAVDAGSAPGLAIEESPVGAGATEVERRQLTDSDVREILLAEIGDRLGAAETYEGAGRHDRAERLRAEADLLVAYLQSGT